MSCWELWVLPTRSDGWQARIRPRGDDEIMDGRGRRVLSRIRLPAQAGALGQGKIGNGSET